MREREEVWRSRRRVEREGQEKKVSNVRLFVSVFVSPSPSSSLRLQLTERGPGRKDVPLPELEELRDERGELFLLKRSKE